MNSKGKSLLEYKEFGKIAITLKSYMNNKGISRNSVCKRTGISYTVINRLYKGQDVQSIDTGVLAKLCYVLDCEISDIITFHEPD